MAHADEPDHFPYADAMACGLASVVLLLFAVLASVGAGRGTSEAFALVTVEFEFPDVPKALAAEARLGGQLLVAVAPDGRAAPGELFARGAAVSLLEQAALFETPPGTAPMVA